MWLKVAAHTHLADSASTAQFLEHIPEEGLKVSLQLAFVRLEAVVTMVLLQGQVAVQATQQQGAAHLRTRVRPRAPVTKAAGTRLEVEGTRLSCLVGFGSRRVVPGLLPRCRWWYRRSLRQLRQHLFEALSDLGFIAAFVELCFALLLQAAALLKLALCLRFPFQPQLMLPLPLFLFPFFLAR